MLLCLQLVLKYHEILGEWLALAKAIVARNKVRLTMFRYGILCVMCIY